MFTKSDHAEVQSTSLEDEELTLKTQIVDYTKEITTVNAAIRRTRSLPKRVSGNKTKCCCKLSGDK
jgi:hypothetical protein